MTILPDALDWDSYIECSDSEDQDDHESTYGGNAQSILSGLEESIGRIDDFLAFERRFLHGDIVRALEDPSEQMGQVINVDMIVDLEAVSGEIVKAVNTQNLIKLRSFSLGDYVVHGPWLGKVVKVVDLVTILFDDGAKYKMRTEDPEILVRICSDMLEDAQYPYYPGQRVRVRLSSVFECGLWKGSQNEGIVCHVEVGSLCINWITSVMVGTDFSGPTPPSWQDPKDLTLLSCFSQVNWQLGDWCSFQFGDYKNNDLGKEKLILPNISGENLTTLYRGMHRRNPDFGQKFLLVKTKTKVDVLWQDGNYSVGLDSQTLTAVGHVGDHEFWPQQYVMEKGTYDNSIAADQRVGIVKSMNAKERTVRVEWAFSGVNGAVGSNAKFNEETVSAYGLLEHPEFSYCMGDVVIRLIQNTKNSVKFLPVSQTDRENQSHKDSTNVKLDRVTSTTTRELIGDCQGYACDYLSCIGIVTGIKDGRIEVKWASGLISKVEPHDIVGIERHEDTASTPVSYEDDIDVHASEGMLAYKKQSSFLNKEKGVLEKAVIGSSKDHKSDLWDASALSLPRAALGFLTSVATSLFGSHGSSSIKSTFFNKLSEKDELDIEDMPSSKDQSEILIKASLKQQEVETQEREELACGTESEKLGPSFKQFDTVTDYLDHHFANGIGNESMLPDVSKGWLKRVNQEWEILERNLPDTIYVRVYEERMDLMRAAIIGAPETPYHDGLFFFDIFVPPDYPSEPPIVHYKSGGLRLNPNLYESGRVCLSLLKTWTGIGSEMWNPDKSTIIQVLLSLQALVLNEKPYFNEAGYDQQVGRAEGEKNSTAYNENAFLLSCKSSMLYMLRNPPKHFEALVEEHFRSRSHSILLACQAYMDGAQVGCAFKSGKVARDDQKSSSTGFRIMLAKLFPLLVKAFGENGIDCHKFLEQIDEVPKLG